MHIVHRKPAKVLNVRQNLSSRYVNESAYIDHCNETYIKGVRSLAGWEEEQHICSQQEINADIVQCHLHVLCALAAGCRVRVFGIYIRSCKGQGLSWSPREAQPDFTQQQVNQHGMRAGVR